MQSAWLWLALEVKGVQYRTVLVEPRGDTYDGSPTEGEFKGTDGYPSELRGGELPQLRRSMDADVGIVDTELRQQTTHSVSGGMDDAGCLELLLVM